MTNPAEKLKAARDQIVGQRRQVAERLAEAYKRGDTERMRDLFIVLQNTIEAIDRAIADEQRLEGGDKSPGVTIRMTDR